MDIFRVACVIHDGYLDGHVLLRRVQVDDVVEEVYATGVDVADELLQSVLAMEDFLARLPVFVLFAHVRQSDGDAGVQVGQLAHAVGQDFVFVFSGDEDVAVRPELLACAPQSVSPTTLTG